MSHKEIMKTAEAVLEASSNYEELKKGLGDIQFSEDFKKATKRVRTSTAKEMKSILDANVALGTDIEASTEAEVEASTEAPEVVPEKTVGMYLAELCKGLKVEETRLNEYLEEVLAHCRFIAGDVITYVQFKRVASRQRAVKVEGKRDHAYVTPLLSDLTGFAKGISENDEELTQLAAISYQLFVTAKWHHQARGMIAEKGLVIEDSTKETRSKSLLIQVEAEESATFGDVSGFFTAKQKAAVASSKRAAEKAQAAIEAEEAEKEPEKTEEQAVA